MKVNLAEQQLNSIIDSCGGIDEIPDPYAYYFQSYLRAGEYELAAHMLLDAFIDEWVSFDVTRVRELIKSYNLKTSDQEGLDLAFEYADENEAKK